MPKQQGSVGVGLVNADVRARFPLKMSSEQYIATM
jgi:hypothetical protein